MVKKTTQDLREMSKQSKYSCIRATLEKGYATKNLFFSIISNNHENLLFREYFYCYLCQKTYGILPDLIFLDTSWFFFIFLSRLEILFKCL